MRQAVKDSGEGGAVIIESAMVLLTLFTFIFAIWEAGRFLNVQNVVTNAAREGARLSVTPLTQTSILPTDSDIQARVDIFLHSSAIKNGTTTITRTTDANGRTFTEVSVAVPYSFLTLPLFGDALDVTLKGNANMRNETSP